MSSKRYFAWILGAVALAGCGTKSTTTGTGGSGTTASVTNTTGSSKVTSSSASSGTGGAGGNHTFATATPIKVNDPATQATLTDVKGQDFYSFTAKKGERLFIAVLAPGAKGFDPTVIDPAFGLYDATNAMAMKPMPLAYQSGGFPQFSQDSSIFVQIPADGTYYLVVADCNGFFSMGCPNPAMNVSNLDYQLLVSDTQETLATMQDGTTAKAMPVMYKADTQAGVPAGTYFDAILGGQFQSATDTHVFKFTPPANTMLTMGAQARAEFYVQPIGGGAQNAQGGDLSASNIKIWATDATTGAILSSADQSHFLVDGMNFSPLEFSVPVTLGNSYYLYVQNTHTGGTPATDYYFIDHYLNPLIDMKETKETATQQGNNDTSATAEDPGPQGSAKDFVTLDGNIATVTDVDFLKVAVPSGVTKYQVSCDSARSGSGLGSFKAELIASDGTTSLNSATETPDKDLFTMSAPLPTGVTPGSTVYLKMSAASVDASTPPNTGRQYRCYVFFAK